MLVWAAIIVNNGMGWFFHLGIAKLSLPTWLFYAGINSFATRLIFG